MTAQAEGEVYPQPGPDTPGLLTSNVSQNMGNTAVGNNIQQQYHYHNQYARQEVRENDLAQIIKALSQLILAAGFVIALLTSLIMLLRLVAMITGG